MNVTQTPECHTRAVEQNPVSNYVTSLIRTWVPAGVGVVVSWLVAHEVAVDAQDAATLGAVLTGVFTAIWYAIWRLAEQWVSPVLGWFLGLAKKPNYPTTPPGP